MGPLTPAAVDALEALGRVLARGVHGADRAWIAEVPVLADAVLGLGDAEALAVEHQRVLGREVLAWEGVFTTPDALRGGAPEAEAAAAFRAHHLEPPGAPDALGAEVLLYAFLLRRDPAAAARFFAAHPGRWAAPALVALGRQTSPLYGAVAALLGELLAPALGEVTVDLPPPVDPLADPRSGLRDISDHLLVPVASGWFLSRRAVQDLARATGIPCGFGSRRQMLSALLRNAADHEAIPELIAVLDAEATAWDAAYAELGAVAWRARLARQRGLRQRLAEASP